MIKDYVLKTINNLIIIFIKNIVLKLLRMMNIDTQF